MDYSDFMAALSSDPTAPGGDVSSHESYERHVQERLTRHIAYTQANQHLAQPWRASPHRQIPSRVASAAMRERRQLQQQQQQQQTASGMGMDAGGGGVDDMTIASSNASFEAFMHSTRGPSGRLPSSYTSTARGATAGR